MDEAPFLWNVWGRRGLFLPSRLPAPNSGVAVPSCSLPASAYSASWSSLLLEAAELVWTGLSLPRTLAGLVVTGGVGGTRQEEGRASESSLLIHRDPDSEGLGWGLLAQNPARAWERNKHGELS